MLEILRDLYNRISELLACFPEVKAYVFGNMLNVEVRCVFSLINEPVYLCDKELYAVLVDKDMYDKAYIAVQGSSINPILDACRICIEQKKGLVIAPQLQDMYNKALDTALREAYNIGLGEPCTIKIYYVCLSDRHKRLTIENFFKEIADLIFPSGKIQVVAILPRYGIVQECGLINNSDLPSLFRCLGIEPIGAPHTDRIYIV